MISNIVRLTIMLTIFWQPNVLALQEFRYHNGVKIKAEISADSANRIEFGRMGIGQVIGDDSKYQLVLDNKFRQIFLTPKTEVGEVIEVSLINLAGMIADLQLIPKKMEAQIIRINTDVVVEEAQSKSNQERKIMMMTRAMLANRKGEYYVTPMQRTIGTIAGGKLKVIQDCSYRYGARTGARLLVSNLTKQTYSLQESDFSKMFVGTVATNIQNRTLAPKEQTIVLVIAEEQKQ